MHASGLLQFYSSKLDMHDTSYLIRSKLIYGLENFLSAVLFSFCPTNRYFLVRVVGIDI